MRIEGQFMSMRSMSTKNVVWARSEEIEIRVRDKMMVGDGKNLGFTLIELLVVISIISLLMAILVPALGKVRHQARSLKGMNNQKQITSALNLFASDNNERYPESVATVGVDRNWNWSDPTKLIGDKSKVVRLTAYVALGKIGRYASGALPSLKEKLASTDTRLIMRCAIIGSSTTSCPKTDIFPSSGMSNVAISRINVDLPPPLGPRTPKISPR